MAGSYLALALVSGVLSARATGQGRDIDVTLFDTALFNLNYLATWYLGAGHNQGREPRSAHPSLTPCQLYRTSDDWIYLMCNKEKFWGELCRKVGHPEWAMDPRFARFPERLRNRDILTDMLDSILTQKTTAEWMEHFAGIVPAAPLNTVASALDSQFNTERGRIKDFKDADGRNVRMLASPIQCPGEEYPDRAGPGLGVDTDALLDELGYSPEKKQQLLKNGVG